MRQATPAELCDSPERGDSALQRGRVWWVEAVEYHLNSTDISWLTIVSGKMSRRICLAEWVRHGGYRDMKGIRDDH